MKKYYMATLIAGLAAALPGSLAAQPHPQGGHPSGGGHPAPAMHAPSAGFHGPASHPVMHHPVSHYAGHPTAHHVITHHVIHHHVAGHVTHHISAVHGRTHLSAKVAGLRRNITAAHRFHVGAYRAPPGYHYRRWGYGQFLPALYWGHDFWITDFLNYGLFGPPDGYVWVRYGPDALLIDQYTGEILQVDYGVFY